MEYIVHSFNNVCAQGKSNGKGNVFLSHVKCIETERTNYLTIFQGKLVKIEFYQRNSVKTFSSVL